MAHVRRDVAVRPERHDDHAAVYRVHELAFGRRDEADLVDRLRAAGKAIVSLVAEDGGEVVGHALFSPVSVEAQAAGCPAVGLGPIAVLPDRHRQGIGQSLVRRGLDECKRLGHERVVVLGHPAYYRRFGFLPASRFGLRCEYDAPEDAFMAMELRPGALTGCTGRQSTRPSSEASPEERGEGPASGRYGAFGPAPRSDPQRPEPSEGGRGQRALRTLDKPADVLRETKEPTFAA